MNLTLKQRQARLLRSSFRVWSIERSRERGEEFCFPPRCRLAEAPISELAKLGLVKN